MKFKMSLGLMGILIIIDQAVKYYVLSLLKPISSIMVVPGLLKFTYVENYGAAFGIFSGAKWFLIILTGSIIATIVYMIYKKVIDGKLLIIAFSMIVAGGLGNLIDRIRLGYVVDYIDINQLFRYPMFNFADCCVVIGAITVVYYVLFIESKQLKRKDGESNNT